MTSSFLLEIVALSIRTAFVLLSVVITWATIGTFARLFTRSKAVDAPRVGKDPRVSGPRRARSDFAQNGKVLVEEGYSKYKDSMYWIQTGDMERLVISNRFVDELRKLPDGYLDSKTAVVERNLGWYNGIDIILKSNAHANVCRTKLVQSLGKHTRCNNALVCCPLPKVPLLMCAASKAHCILDSLHSPTADNTQMWSLKNRSGSLTTSFASS